MYFQHLQIFFSLASVHEKVNGSKNCQKNSELDEKIIQFKQNIKTKELQLAPIYDYANCNLSVKDTYITKNVLFNVTEGNINELVERYPKYKEYISILLSHSLKNIWEQICIDYKLNMDCFTYDRVKDYYELKEENQKIYLKKIINDIHL